MNNSDLLKKHPNIEKNFAIIIKNVEEHFNNLMFELNNPDHDISIRIKKYIDLICNEHIATFVQLNYLKFCIPVPYVICLPEPQLVSYITTTLSQLQQKIFPHTNIIYYRNFIIQPCYSLNLNLDSYTFTVGKDVPIISTSYSSILFYLIFSPTPINPKYGIETEISPPPLIYDISPHEIIIFDE